MPDSVFSAGGGRSSVEAWYSTALDIVESLPGVMDSDVHIFVADVIKSFDTVDRGILDYTLSKLGLPGWFRHAYFEYHAKVRLRFKLSCGLGPSWTRDGGIPQGCPLSMLFIVALYLSWCRHLESFRGVKPQQYADNLRCVSSDNNDLLEAARFTNTYIRLVGQAPAPSKCILLSTSAVVRGLMKGSCLRLETNGLLSWTHETLGGTWILPIGDGTPLLLGEFLGCWLLFWWHLILLASFGFYGPSFCLGLYTPLRVLGSLLDCCSDFDLPLSLPLGQGRCPWLMLVQF